MKIPREDVPQADNIDDVIKLVEGVGKGIDTYQDLSHHIGKVERQGRYYRRAAEILGLIKNAPRSNHSELTSLGRQYLNANPKEKKQILANAVLSSRLIQRMIPFFEGKGKRGTNRDDVKKFIADVTEPAGPTMIPRRASSVIAWLSYIDAIKKQGNQYVLDKLPEGVELIDYTADDEPLFPKKYKLNEYQHLSRTVNERNKNITILVDEAQRERASGSHRMLTNMMAERIRKAGAIPKRNRLVDLSTSIADQIYLFEMKSTTESNAHDQIRRGISQLYEYQYVQQIEKANLVLVIENPLPKKLQWLLDYLIEDRGILVVWDGDRKNFHCPRSLKKELQFIF